MTAGVIRGINNHKLGILYIDSLYKYSVAGY